MFVTDYETKDHAADDVPATGEDADGIERDVWAALYQVEDPEMPVSIVDRASYTGSTCPTATPRLIWRSPRAAVRGEIILVDIAEERVEGEAMDLNHGAYLSPDWSVDW